MTIVHINRPANALAIGYADGRNVFGPRDARYAHIDVETGLVILSDLPCVVVTEAQLHCSLPDPSALVEG